MENPAHFCVEINIAEVSVRLLAHPGKPDHKHGPVSGAGSPSTTTNGPTPPMEGNRPPWSTST
jgi:hypothetical protein